MKKVLKTRRRIFPVVFILVFVFVLAGCANAQGRNQIWVRPADRYTECFQPPVYLSFSSLGQIAGEKVAVAKNDYRNDPHNLEGLDHYYIPVYAEKHWTFLSGELHYFKVTYNYTSIEGNKESNAEIWVRNDMSYELLDYMLSPYRATSRLKPVEGVEGVYYEELYDGWNADNPMTYFYWIHDGHFISMGISKELIEEIRKKYLDALKGPLFELQRVDMGQPDETFNYSLRMPLQINSLDEIVQAKKEVNLAKDPDELNSLEYYFLPAYAVSRWKFTAGSISAGAVNFKYDVVKPDRPKLSNDFALYVSRPEGPIAAVARLERVINPKAYADDSAPKLLEGTDGIYYKECYGWLNDDFPVAEFYWVHEDHYYRMRISKDLMDEIHKNDPAALKGPLFELQKVELK